MHAHRSAVKGFDWEDGAAQIGDYNEVSQARVFAAAGAWPGSSSALVFVMRVRGRSEGQGRFVSHTARSGPVR